jgi:hypothetical protein
MNENAVTILVMRERLRVELLQSGLAYFLILR